MFTRNLERAVRVAALIAVAAGPMWAAAQGATGSSGEPSGGMGAAGAAKSPGGAAQSGGTGSSGAEAGKGHMPPSPAAMQKMKPSQLYEMMDKDKDGYVTKEEFLKFQEHVFDTWDKNKTGKLGQVIFTDAG